MHSIVTLDNSKWGKDYDKYFHISSNRIDSPNPSNQSTTLSFDLASPTKVEFEIINLSGKSGNQIENAHYEEGVNQFELQTSNLRNGVYFVKFTSDHKTNSRSALKKI